MTLVPRIGFRIVEPAGWVRLAADTPDTAEVRALAKTIASASAVALRPQIETFVYDQLWAALTEASAKGGTDLLLPTGLVAGAPVPMSIVVAVVPLGEFGAADSQSDALLAYAARHDGARAVEIDGSLAVRSVVDVGAIEGTDDASRAFDTRRVSYVIAAPTIDRRMMVVTSSMKRELEDKEDKVLEAMEFLFDSMMGTVRIPAEEAAR